jgi:branched-chain amino acid transport system ATP-binding protein
MLEITKIDAGYGDTKVLRGVSLVVPEGRVVALLGANGAGKTTLLRAASGLLRPSAGHVRVDGHDVTGWAPHRLVGLGLCHIPEGHGVFPQLTVRENLVLQSPAGHEAASIDGACRTFPVLGQRLGQRAGSLSGGEQQMLALARAHVNSPRLVLLDEVSMGLAPIVVDQIFGFLERLAKQGSALLLVEQYMTRALELADYVYILTRGTMRFAGEPAELQDEALFHHYIEG